LLVSWCNIHRINRQKRQALDIMSCYEFLSRYKLCTTLRIRVSHSLFSFYKEELNIRVSFTLNRKVIDLIIDLINNLNKQAIKNQRAHASRSSEPLLVAPTLTRNLCVPEPRSYCHTCDDAVEQRTDRSAMLRQLLSKGMNNILNIVDKYTKYVFISP
jgi:hypothetical protein